MKIALIGDYNATNPAHQAIPIALQLIGEKLNSAIVLVVPNLKEAISFFEDAVDYKSIHQFILVACTVGMALMAQAQICILLKRDHKTS